MRPVNLTPNDFPNSQSSLENYNVQKVDLNIKTDIDNKHETRDTHNIHSLSPGHQIEPTLAQPANVSVLESLKCSDKRNYSGKFMGLSKLSFTFQVIRFLLYF